MKLYDRKTFTICVGFTVIIAIISLFTILNDEKKYASNRESLQNIVIEGSYFIEGKREKTSLPKDNKFNLSGHNEIVITGKFAQDIPKNKLLIMRIDNLKVNIYVNGDLAYSFGERNAYPEYVRSPGNVWERFVSPGIKSTDNITITLSNVYTNHVDTSFKTFLDNFYYGYEGKLIIDNISEGLLNTFISIFIVCLGIGAIFLCYVLYRMKKSIASAFCFACLSIFSGVWFFIDFTVQVYFIPYPVFNNSLDIISLNLTAALLAAYFSVNIKGKLSKSLLYIGYFNLLLTIISTYFQFFSRLDYYDFTPIIYVLSILSAVTIAVSLLTEFHKFRTKEIKGLIISSLIISLGILGDVICNYFQIIPYVVWFKWAFFVFMIVEFSRIANSVMQFINESAKLEVLKELAYKDGLTGVKNRTSYLEKVSEIDTLIKLKKGRFSAIVFDVNNLKYVNDNLGHEFGDIMIKSVAKVICETFDENSVYRIGGDEFVVILDRVDNNRNTELLEQLNINTENYNNDPFNCIRISFARGISTYNKDTDSCYKDVFERADSAMYKNKAEVKAKINKEEIYKIKVIKE